VVVVGIVFGVAAEAWAQSTDIENPTPLTTNAMKGALAPNSTGNQYHAFRAGPGEVTVTATVEAVGGYGYIQVQLLNANLVSLCSEAIGANNQVQTGMCTASLKTEQRVILRLNLQNGCKGCTYRLRIDGMRGAGAQAAATPSPAVSAPAPRPSTPAAGAAFRTMLIRLKDGTTMQIDLAKVAEITFK
jgi:hypothetical protein